jgi:hypothetical protein
MNLDLWKYNMKKKEKIFEKKKEEKELNTINWIKSFFNNNNNNVNNNEKNNEKNNKEIIKNKEPPKGFLNYLKDFAFNTNSNKVTESIEIKNKKSMSIMIAIHGPLVKNEKNEGFYFYF